MSGNKKDVVVTPQLHDGSRPPPPRVAIYGWIYPDGTVIQPLSLVHEETYADYSHGIRLVRSRMVLNERDTTVATVLRDHDLASLISDEGPLTNARYPTNGAAPPTRSANLQPTAAR